MLLIKKYLSYFCGLLTIVFAEFLINFAKLSSGLWFVLSLFFLLIIMSLWYLQKSRLTNLIEKTTFFLIPIIFLVNAGGFFIFLSLDKIFVHVLIVVIGLILWIYLESFFLKQYFKNFYGQRSFENTAENLLIITVFLFFFNLFNFKIVLDWSKDQLFVVAGLFLLLLTWLSLVVNNVILKDKNSSLVTTIKNWAEKKIWLYLLLVPFLSLEILLVSDFMPTNFFSLALLNTIFIYELLVFSRYRLLEQFSVSVIKKQVSLSLVVLIIIFFFSKWT